MLDSFGGSGTTANAVLKLNKADGGKRSFVLAEMKPSIASQITAERVRRVIQGYRTSKNNQEMGLGGGFQYCQLSDKPLFDADGKIDQSVSFDKLAEFVWFMDTGTGLAGSAISAGMSTPYLGTYMGRAIFLLYNGILKDKSELGGNVLNGRTLAYLNEVIPDQNTPKVVYGARTRFDKTKLVQLGVTFHQLPYELAVKTWF